MNRRDLLVLAALTVAPRAVRAQKARKLPVIGVLNPGFPTYDAASLGLMDGLRELGFVDGATVRIETRWGLGKPELLPAFAEELVQLNVDVILAVARTAINAARLATTVLPIVAIDLESDPIAAGFIDSFAAPRGNITGLFLDQPELTGKWLQLIREIVPGARARAIHHPLLSFDFRPRWVRKGRLRFIGDPRQQVHRISNEMAGHNRHLSHELLHGSTGINTSVPNNPQSCRRQRHRLAHRRP